MKKKILYPLYLIFAIGIVCLCLVLFRDRDSSDYAESMVLNIPRELTVNYGDTYTLPSNYIIIKPESAKAHLTYTITNQAGNVVDLNFDGSRFNAMTLGYFYITFSIPSKNSTLTDTLKIHIVEPQSTQINASQKIDTLTVDKIYNLSDILDITYPSSAEIIVTPSNDNVFYYPATEKMLVKSAGNITFTIDIRYKSQQQRFSFDFILIDPDTNNNDPTTPPADEPNDPNPTDSISIVLRNPTDTIHLSVGQSMEIFYDVINSNDPEVNQYLTFPTENNIYTVQMNMPPLLIIQAKAVGSTTLTLTSIADPNVSITINIIVE